MHHSTHTEKDLFLHLSLNNNIDNLNDLYRNYKCIELLENDNMYKCEKCNTHRRARKKIITSEWKDTIIIILKRFDNMMKKNNKQIAIPLNWRHSYTLQGGIIHSGNFSGGHYTYFGCDNNKWFLANDQSIKEINDIDEFIKYEACNSYILIYNK
jgi:ubiquitin C-terminal hydrolase